MRDFNALLLVPVLKLTGFRFSKDYRYGTTLFHRLVYKTVNVVKANLTAGLDLDIPGLKAELAKANAPKWSNEVLAGMIEASIKRAD
jgi:hypothetical protein